MEGSTGKGNDQYRMHNVFKMFAPELEILVPVRDFDLTRAEEEVLCEAWGVPGDRDRSPAATTRRCGAAPSPRARWTSTRRLPEDIWMWLVPPEKAPDKADEITVDIRRAACPVALNGKRPAASTS